MSKELRKAISFEWNHGHKPEAAEWMLLEVWPWWSSHLPKCGEVDATYVRHQKNIYWTVLAYNRRTSLEHIYIKKQHVQGTSILYDTDRLKAKEFVGHTDA
jgi:hypothetical protein